MNPFIFNLYSEYRSVLYSYLSIQFLKFYLLQHVKPGLHEKAYLICIFLKKCFFCPIVCNIFDIKNRTKLPAFITEDCQSCV